MLLMDGMGEKARRANVSMNVQEKGVRGTGSCRVTIS